MNQQIEPDGNVHTMPMGGPEHVESKECWCEPEMTADETATGGVQSWLHKELQ